VKLLLTARFYSLVDEITAVCTQFGQMAARARADSCDIIKRGTLARKFHTRAIYSLLTGSLTML